MPIKLTESDAKLALRDHLAEKARTARAKHGIDIPYPQRVVHVVQDGSGPRPANPLADGPRPGRDTHVSDHAGNTPLPEPEKPAT